MKLFLLFLLSSLLLADESFQNYLKKHNEEFNRYQNQLNKKFENYQETYDIAFKEYKNNIKDKWPKVETTSNHKWVEYTKNYKSKKVIDYKKEQLRFEVIANHEKEALIKIIKLFEELDTYSVKDAYKNDILENKIANKLDITREALKSDEDLISDLITNKQQKKMIAELSQQKLKNISHNGNEIFIAKIDLPKNSLFHKAEQYRNIIELQNKKTKIPQELIYAIIHAESSFNPLARSYVPAYGLMQIVPTSAGIDAYKHLYGEKKVLKPNYLYNPKNNIILGSTYLKILYFHYLKDIKDPKKRLQCTIAAYNTGTSNVSKAFTGKSNIKEAAKMINSMSSHQVYKRLLRKLPYKETRLYLYKVNKYLKLYKNYLATSY